MSGTTPTVEERLAAVEARLAELERRAAGAPSPRPRLLKLIGVSPVLLDWLGRLGLEERPTTAQEARLFQLDEGADPDSTFCSEEIVRMREEYAGVRLLRRERPRQSTSTR